MKNQLLSKIHSPADLRQLLPSQLEQLAQELRQFIITIVASKEGHLGASLGVVELTIALHYVFDTPNDLLIWDVGHQAYGHKILTERQNIFHTNRQFGGISGFPKRAESVYDAFGVGHSSTSISAALGMALASQLKGDTHKNHIAVIGDASIASGMAFEGLNHAGVTGANLLVILNDNAIGIDPSVGALKNYLTTVKEGHNPKANNLIQSLNFDGSGPIDGHNITLIIKELERLKKIKGPKFLHLITTKGKGLHQAETHQVTYHAPGKFNANTGELMLKSDVDLPPKFQDVFGKTILELAHQNPNIIGITPAMPTGSSLKLMMEVYPTRALDVGIAEQHAVTLAAGMATQGMVVYCNIYSTFLQRAYDQVIHDVALQQLPVVFCLDRAGLVGEDGATHHGVFDLAFLSAIPNMIVFAPKDAIELRNILYTAQLGLQNPIAIRYPRGRCSLVEWEKPFEKITIGQAICLKKGRQTALLTTGTMTNVVSGILSKINQNSDFGHYHFGFVKPLDCAALKSITSNYQNIITLEDGTVKGGFGAAIGAYVLEHQLTNRVKILGIPDAFIEHGSMDMLHKHCGLDPENLTQIFETFNR